MKVILEAQQVCTPTPRGIPYYAFQLIRQLLKRKANDYGLSFFDFNRERNNRQWVDKYFGKYNVPIYECNAVSYKDIIENKYDVFNTKSYNDYIGAYGDVFHFSSLCPIPSKLEGKMIVTVHDLIPLRFPEYVTPIITERFHLNIERLMQMQPFVITDSESSKEDILYFSDIPKERIQVIPLAYDMDHCFQKNNTNTLAKLGIDFPYLLYLGAIETRKNIVRIVEAFEPLAEKFSDFRLVIAGIGDDNIVSRINESKFKSRIIMFGYVSDEEKYALYSRAAVFLFPSLCEGFGLPVIEAMACGCPVITSNVSSLPEVAGDAAILIDPYNTEQLEHEIERVVSSESLREELKQKGLEQSKKFSWEKTAELTEEIYRRANDG